MKDSNKSYAAYPDGFFDFEGRIGRTKYAVICLLATVIATPIFAAIGDRNTFGELLLIGAAFLVLSPTTVKRLHDIDRDGTWVWALFIPFLNVVVQIRLLFQAGTPIGNRFGIRPSLGTRQFLHTIKDPWWKLDTRLRLVIVASTVWVLGAYLMQEKYDKNMDVVFIPAFAALALHFLVRFTVERTENQLETVPISQSLPATTPHGQESNPNDMYAGIAAEFETDILDKGLWIRLFAECDGDETKTKVRYIKERMLMLSNQQKSQQTQSRGLRDNDIRAKDKAIPVAAIELSPKERERAMEEMIKRMQ